MDTFRGGRSSRARAIFSHRENVSCKIPALDRVDSIPPDLAALCNVAHNVNNSRSSRSRSLNADTLIGSARIHTRRSANRQSSRCRRLSVSPLALSRARYRIEDHAGITYLRPFPTQNFLFLSVFLSLISSSLLPPSCFPFRVSFSQQIAERITVNTELSLFILISSDICIISYSVFTKIYISLFQHFGYWKPIVK